MIANVSYVRSRKSSWPDPLGLDTIVESDKKFVILSMTLDLFQISATLPRLKIRVYYYFTSLILHVRNDSPITQSC